MENPGIEATRERFRTALARRDPFAMAACYTDDAVLLAAGLPAVEGRAGIEAFWWAGLEAGLCAVDIAIAQVQELGHAHGAARLERGSATIVMAEEPPATACGPDPIPYLAVPTRQGGGSWRWAVQLFGLHLNGHRHAALSTGEASVRPWCTPRTG